MEAFHVLSRGGVRFDKQRFKSDVQLFSNKVCAPTFAFKFSLIKIIRKEKMKKRRRLFLMHNFLPSSTSSSMPKVGRVKGSQHITRVQV